MADYARPNADVAAGTWTTAPLYESINETPYSDTDFISGPNRASSTCQIGLSSVADPGVHTGHIMRVRAYLSNTGVTLTFELREGTTLRKAWNPGVTTGGFQTYTLTLTEAEAGTITNYSNLRIYCIQTFTSGSGTRRSYVSWFELEVPLSNQNIDETAQGDKKIYISENDQVNVQDNSSLNKKKFVSVIDNINKLENADSLILNKVMETSNHIIIEETLYGE